MLFWVVDNGDTPGLLGDSGHVHMQTLVLPLMVSLGSH